MRDWQRENCAQIRRPMLVAGEQAFETRQPLGAACVIKCFKQVLTAHWYVPRAMIRADQMSCHQELPRDAQPPP